MAAVKTLNIKHPFCIFFFPLGPTVACFVSENNKAKSAAGSSSAVVYVAFVEMKVHPSMVFLVISALNAVR